MSPKQQFLLSEQRARAHRDLMVRQEIVDGLLIAFNELCWNLPKAESTATSWAANARRQGAQDLIMTFLTLGDQTVPRQPSTIGKLEDQDARFREHFGSPTAGD